MDVDELSQLGPAEEPLQPSAEEDTIMVDEEQQQEQDLPTPATKEVLELRVDEVVLVVGGVEDVGEDHKQLCLRLQPRKLHVD